MSETCTVREPRTEKIKNLGTIFRFTIEAGQPEEREIDHIERV